MVEGVEMGKELRNLATLLCVNTPNSYMQTSMKTKLELCLSSSIIWSSEWLLQYWAKIPLDSFLWCMPIRHYKVKSPGSPHVLILIYKTIKATTIIASFPAPTQLSITFLYCKQWKAGQGLRTRLPQLCIIQIAAMDWIVVARWE